MVYKVYNRIAHVGSTFYIACKECITDSLQSNAKATDIQNQLRPYGTEGWLGFFIGECYLYPLNALVTFILIYNKSSHPYMVDNLIVYLSAVVILSYLGIRAGVALRKIQPDAVSKAKTFLVFTLIWAFISVFISQNYFYSNRSIAYYYKSKAVGIMFNFVLWYGYLALSKRVKNTYPDYYHNFRGGDHDVQ